MELHTRIAVPPFKASFAPNEVAYPFTRLLLLPNDHNLLPRWCRYLLCFASDHRRIEADHISRALRPVVLIIEDSLSFWLSVFGVVCPSPFDD